MLRSSRPVVSLIRSLVLGTAASTTAATALLATAVVGCQDESQPDYWVEKLSDTAWKARAVKRLEQFFEDAVTKNGNDIKAQGVQDLINKTVEPLTKAYVTDYDTLDSKTRVSLIKLLASYRDKRTEPALKKAFEEFAKRPATAKDESDIKWAARATGDLKLESLATPMVEAFAKLRASTMLGGVVYKDLNESMLDMPSKSWVGPLMARLDAEITPPKPKEPSTVDDYKDQLFWQTTAAELLGRIGDPQAVESLMKVMLDPTKADVQATALLALVKLGKPTVDTATKLLQGKDEKLVSFAMRRLKEISGKDVQGTPYVSTAALVLGTSGRADAVPVLVAAVGAEKDAPTRAIMARELTKLPETEESKAAFKTAFESFTLETEIPPAGGALEALTEAAGAFYDPSLVDWLLERAAVTKGSGDDLKGFQAGVTVTAMKLAKPDQLPAVKAAVDRYGTQLEKDVYKQVEAQVKACGDRVACYIASIQKGENQETKTQFGGIKAGYMIGVLGNDASRDELLAALDGINNAAVRFVAAQAIDHLTPKGSKPVSEKLNAIISKNSKSADREKAANDAPLKQVMYRIDARN
jgi:HEAT repeat protein